MAGRFEMLRIPQWSYDEMQRAFGWDLEPYVLFGWYQGTASLSADTMLSIARFLVAAETYKRNE